MTSDYPPEYAVVRPGDELSWDLVARYLRSQLEGLGPLEAVWQFPNGSANLTYLLEFADRRLVIRRPPFGDIAIGAHDMKREYRALSRLWCHYDRAPRAYLLCEDDAVAGADFVVIEYRPGQVVRGTIPPDLAAQADVGRRIGFAVVEALADLHRLDPDQAGVADLGRPDGFVDRQLRGWRLRWDAVAGDSSGDHVVARVGAELAASRPAAKRATVVHNDFKIDNCQFNPGNPDRVQSVFDWDMATLGDPLIDLGTLLNYWPDPSDGPVDRPMYPAGQETMGLPSRAEIKQRYAAITGVDLADITWYEAFGCWKTAIVVAQLYRRYLQGHSNDDRQAGAGDHVSSLARRAQAILAGR